MSIPRGTRLGSYEVIAELGRGGMGEVYRARDTRLNRDVALKCLPASFATDPDRVMRFEREARTLAALNHANIAAIFGLEGEALVMELVEGEDLSDRILAGAIPLDDALPIAKQIAEALEAAHEAGIIHRDLKPANIKVRPDGTVKVLDFGLAKALTPDGTSVTQDATMTSPAMTQMGLILGTAAYMAPEQAKGRPVDKRADIWAFGVVLYEMLTGARLFQAEDVSETLAAVLTRDVHASVMTARIPSSLRALVADCLVRDPRKRLRDMGDVRLRLDQCGADADAAITTVATASMSSRRVWPAIAAVSTVVAVALAALYLLKPAAAPLDVITFELAVPDLSVIDAISPDGRHVVYGAVPAAGQPARLWVRPLGSMEARPVPGTEGVLLRPYNRPVWSPDSRAVLFADHRSLRRVDVTSGQSTELVKTQNNLVSGGWLRPGGWSRDGVVLYGIQRVNFETGNGGIWRVADTAGPPVQVSVLRDDEQAHEPSGFLPDGRRFLYFVVGSVGEGGGEIRVGAIDAPPAEQNVTPLLRADGPAIYADGHLLFVSGGRLMAQPFDAGSATVTGTPIQLVPAAAPVFSASTNGRIVYRLAVDDACELSELVRMDRSGRALGTVGPPAYYGPLNALPGGGRVAVGRSERCEATAQHIHVVELARAQFNRLNPGTQSDSGPTGSREDLIAFTYSPAGESRDLYVRATNGVGDPRLLVTSGTVKHANDWSPDSKYLIYDDHVPGRAQDLMVVPKEGGTPIPFLATAADETYGQFSPSGQWIAYRSNESGRNEVYVRDFAPDRTPAHGNQKIKISVNGGDKPRWSVDGSEIYFLQGSMMTAVKVRPGHEWVIGGEEALFETRPNSYLPFDVLGDGTFILNNVVTSRTTAPPLRVLMNWGAALNGRQ
jgi:hypothetical protein